MADILPFPRSEFDFRTLPEMLRLSVFRYGERPLFGTKVDGRWHWTTYREFRELAAMARDRLEDMGVGRGDRVAIISENRLEFAVVAYAAFDLGAAIVAMYESQTDANWEYIIRDCGAKALYASDQRILARVRSFRARLPVLRHVAAFEDGAAAFLAFSGSPAREISPRSLAEPNDIATIIYTSGTTGEPKGVPLTHANICANVRELCGLFPLGPDDRSMSFLPWAHIFGQVVEMHCMLAIGASVGICESTDKIVANLAEVQPTILFSVPRIYERIHDGVRAQMAKKPAVIQRLFERGIAAAKVRAAGGALGIGERALLFLADRLLFSRIRAKFGGKLRFAISGGASLAGEIAAFVDALGIQVHEAYGLTETGCISTNTPDARRMGTVGCVLRSVTMELDESVCDEPGTGEIVVSGPSVMRGYLNRPDANAEAFTPRGAFRTGDLGRFTSDGFLQIVGRIKEQYKLANGKYVAPAPIEDRLKASPLISNAMVYGDNRQYNVALIVPHIEALIERMQAAGFDATPDTIPPGGLFAIKLARDIIAAEVARCCADVTGLERIAKFALIAEDFTVENGMLTPTFKLRRRNVLARYGAEIEKLYD